MNLSIICESADTPKIWVGDYASYNQGKLCGKWFDLTDYDDHQEFYEAIKEMFKEFDESEPLDFGLPREEPMFNDYENIPDEFIGESWISPNFWEYYEAISEKNWDDDQLAFAMDCLSSYNLTDSKTDIKSLVDDIQITECSKYDLSLHYLIHWLGLMPEDAQKVHNCVDDDYCIQTMQHEVRIEENGSTYLTDMWVET